MDNRQRIIENAAVLFRTYGIRAVTMDMLANQMGISKRTIYELFNDKDELLHGVMKYMEEKQGEVLMKTLSDSENVIEAIFKILDLMSNHLKKMSSAFLLDIRKKHLSNTDQNSEMHFFGFNEEVVKKGIKEGVFREDIDVKISNMCLFEVGKMTNEADLSETDEFVRKDVIKNLYINYLRGISTQKGLDLINFYEKKTKNNL